MTLNNYVDNIYKNSQGIHRIPDVRDDVHPGWFLFRFCTDVYPSPLQRVSVSGHAYFRPINEGTLIHSLRKTDQPGPARTSSYPARSRGWRLDMQSHNSDGIIGFGALCAFWQRPLRLTAPNVSTIHSEPAQYGFYSIIHAHMCKNDLQE